MKLAFCCDIDSDKDLNCIRCKKLLHYGDNNEGMQSFMMLTGDKDLTICLPCFARHILDDEESSRIMTPASILFKLID